MLPPHRQMLASVVWLIMIARMNGSTNLLSPQEALQLDTEGYLILRNFIAPEQLAALRQKVEAVYAEQGESAGTEYRQEPQTRRLANLVNWGELFEDVVADAKILPYVQQVLGAEFKLSSLNFRSANPHSDWVQPLHCDVGALPDEKGFWVCNVIWLLDDFTARVDTNTETKILQNLRDNYPGITLISVTQKIATVEQYDQIIVLMEGEIVASGIHTDLMKQSPEYIQIFNSQQSTSNYELQPQ